MKKWSIEGWAIVCEAGCIADAAGRFPQELTNAADWDFFQAGLDGCAAVVLGRASHEAAPDARGRLRVVMSRSARGLERRGAVFWWNPARVPAEGMLATVAPEGGRVGVPGGRGAFDLFLARGWDSFFLSRKAGVRLTGGVPVFSGVGEGRSPEDALAGAGLAPGPERVLDAAARVSVREWRRAGAG